MCAVIYLGFLFMILFLVDSQVLSDSSSEDDEVQTMEGMLNKRLSFTLSSVHMKFEYHPKDKT